MDAESLKDLARYQAWADGEYWKVFQTNVKLLEDADVRKRLGHMVGACQMLQTLARGETPGAAGTKGPESAEELRPAMEKAHQGLTDALGSVDLERMMALPRGPKGPFEAPAGVLLLQALMHSQHHRGQNGARMRELGVTPPMTDFVIWYALGRP